jgi:cell division transport system ATP-binding protein
LIKVKNLRLKYPHSKDFIFDDVSFEINQGDFVVLSGDSGSGKSTLLNLLHLNLNYESGEVEIFNKDISKLSRLEKSKIRQKMGFIFQGFNLLNDLTVFDNVALPLIIAKKPMKEISSTVDELLRWIDLSNKKDELPVSLSGGEKQKVAIARAIINKPKLILADEPTGSIDIQTGDKILKLLQEMNKLGTTVILATHSQRIKNKIKGKTFSLFEGNIIQESYNDF